MRIHGLDWSGARDAGKKSWLATAEHAGGVLRMRSVRRALDDGARRAPEVRRWVIGSVEVGWIGCDFPFSLPASLADALDVHPPVAADLVERYPTPTSLRDAARRALDHEPRRQTDRDTGAPWAPTNLRMVAQTHAGMQLLGEAGWRVLPWMAPARINAVEVCPAVVLESLGLAGVRYKGRKAPGKPNRDRVGAREGILERLERVVPIALGPVRTACLEDVEGDALDAVLACVSACFDAAVLARSEHDRLCREAGEGWVYSRPEARRAQLSRG